MAADVAAASASGPTAGGAGFVFAHLPSGWLVPVLLVAAAAAAWWGWKRYGPPPGSRLTGLVARGARSLALALLVLMAAGPAWRTATTTVTPGALVIAVDGSASMAVEDGAAGAPRIAEAAALATVLRERVDPANASLRWSLIAAGDRSGDLDPASISPATANGSASPLADDLDRLVARTRPDALVVVTDGRVTDGGSFARLAEAWRGKGLRLAVLATGTDAVVPDLAIDEVVVNREAALDEREPVAVRLSHRGLPAGPVKVTVQVDDEPAQAIDAPQGTTADAAVMATTEARTEVVFRREGTARLTVTAAVSTAAGERRASQTVSVSVRERKLTVLLLDNRPRYEMRYLREAFKRDKTVTLHAYLAEGRWRRWGGDGPDRLPLTAADLAAYDVVILGDLGPDSFRAADLANLEAAVRKGGTGLVWVPGETGATAGFAGQKLGELLPVELGDATALGRGYLGAPRALSRTEAATRLGLLEPGETEWNKLPALLGAAPIATVKAGSEVLAQDQDGKPLVVTRAFGAGRAVLIAVDDTWRWRREAGDRFLHRFHSQLLRFAAANHRGDRRGWRLGANPRRAAPGEPLMLSLAPLRPDAEVPDKAVIRLVPTGDAAGRRELLVPLARDGDGFAARLAAPAPGTWELALAAGPDLSTVEGSDLLVVPSGAERRDPRADRPALDAFAAAMGGTVYTSADELVAHLPTDLRRSETHTSVDGLWDTPWALLLIIALFAIDWALRRWNRLP